MKLVLPFPPSMNHYWMAVVRKRYRPGKSSTYPANILSDRGRAYQGAAKAAVGFVHPSGRYTTPVAVCVELGAPCARRRDLDNYLKPLLDALTHIGVWEDDSLVHHLTVGWGPQIKGGRAIVTIEPIGGENDKA